MKIILSNIPPQTQGGTIWKLEFAKSSSYSSYGDDNDRQRAVIGDANYGPNAKPTIGYNRHGL
jgi:hypothetical protein